MKIIRAADTTTIPKPEGTTVSYYLFHDYEVMYNEQAAHTTQVWHHHEIIAETTFIIKGPLTVHWRENGREHSQQLEKGDLVESGRFAHTFTNDFDTVARFITIKRIPSDNDYHDTFKSDKVLD